MTDAVTWTTHGPTHVSGIADRTVMDALYPAGSVAPDGYNKLWIWGENALITYSEPFFDRPSYKEFLRPNPDIWRNPFLQPRPNTEVVPVRSPRRYRRVPNRARRYHRWGPTYALRVSGNRVTRTRPPKGRPPKRIREKKARLASRAYWVFRRIADALGEAFEWVEMLADAAGYPYGRWRQGRTLLADQVVWLFAEGGIHLVDWELLQNEILHNTVEDLGYGAIGQGSGGAASELGQTTGFQTGLAL